MAETPQSFIEMLRKFGADLNVPRLEIDKVIEIHRKNLEAIGNSAGAITEGAKSIASKQRDIVEGMFREAASMVHDFRPPGGPAEMIARQVEFTRKAFDFTVKNTREIVELANKSAVDAGKILQERVRTGLAEIRDGITTRPSDDRS